MSTVEFIAVGTAMTVVLALVLLLLREVLSGTTAEAKWNDRREAELDAWEASLSPSERAAYRTELAHLEASVRRHSR